ncbi:NIPSNAP family protein [Kordiimonas aquimaris]|uniref:NIPSNAP family protein n=1 Tax=Kordiimonas aquimaris TaxID=707591 RepID=UPI0021D242A5|nr:NIPSNAP family protein [Kordiimonas aquimaris]
MFTCIVKYTVIPERLDDFKEYGTAWIALVKKYGGIHHGYFYPPVKSEKAKIPSASFSFGGLGIEGEANTAFAIFSFETEQTYDEYRDTVADDPDCISITAKFEKAPSYSSYDRWFLTPQFK